MPAAPADLRPAIEQSLAAFASRPLPEAAREFFGTLGYTSKRILPLSGIRDFISRFDSGGRLTERDRESLSAVTGLHFLFQLTDAELSSQSDLFTDATAVDDSRIESYFIFAADLPPGTYTRTALAGLARLINKPLAMPALVLFRYGESLSLAILHRRLNKRDTSRDVLEKATLVKDIRFADPIRAHVEILNDFSLSRLAADFPFDRSRPFVSLHEAWQKRLGAFALSNEFYREIADWYFWAHHQVEDGTIRLPQHCDTEQEQSLFLIRLLTRVIFSWFLVEKRLIPTELFREHRLKELLKEFRPTRNFQQPDRASTYYRAILQNLFFGTLNMPPEQRGFREKKKQGQRFDPNFGVTNLWRYEDDFRQPAEWRALAARVPFLNGGLFDCLDDKSGKKQDNFILDGFSDNPKLACHLPNDLFFGPERTVDLSRDYGEEDKRTARSKKAKVRGLIEILCRYKFTIEENTPLEEEIALDPELLGKVFENLLASYNEDTRTTARKALGAFYTPREIVSYMVDESLKSYLATQVPRCKGALDDLFSNKATLRDIKPDTRDALIAAIGKVKILDPACGSGAFPMGALHRLVDLLQKLDPNNESWKRDRLKVAKTNLEWLRRENAAADVIKEAENRIADIEKSFDTRFHALDFARKLYLIENSIYGVDIQPIATQIAKLRFFIALVVDQKVDPAAPNLGVRPLPNLETRLVAADTLVPLPKPKERQGGLFDDASPEDYAEHNRLKAELTRIRHEHFNARDPRSKRRCREEDERIRGKLRELLKRVGLPADAAKAMAGWDPYDQNAFAPFFDSEWMFGLPIGKIRVQGRASATLLGNLVLLNDTSGQTELSAPASTEIDSGFDIVIGNPPYIRIQTLKQKDPDIVAFYKERYASAAKGNYDIYVVFIEAGLHLLKLDGHLAYICPHKFFNAQYGEPIREVIAKGKHLRHVVHFGDQQVFPGATIYTCLLFLSRAQTSQCRLVKVADFEAWRVSLKGAEGRFDAEEITSAEWNLTVGEAASTFSALKNRTPRLGEVASIFVGVQTSADRIYAFRSRPRKGVSEVQLESRSGEPVVIENALLKPLLMDESFPSYSRIRANQVVLFPYKITDGQASLIPWKELTAHHPRAAAYLKSNATSLKERDGGKWDHPQWYAYGRSQSLAEMDRPKLIVQVVAQSPRFWLDDEKTFFTGGGNGPYYGVRWNDANRDRPLALLQALLNSRVSGFFLRNVSTTFRGGYWSFGKQFIAQIPIPNTAKPQEAVISRLVDFLLWLNGHLADHPETASTRDPLMTAYWEQALNGLVYELYFPEELHAANLRFFDLVASTDLPDITRIADEDRLATLRRKFEELYDIEHPLRAALFSLRDLELVRIIEGKTT